MPPYSVPGERLHAVVGEHRIAVAVRGVSRRRRSRSAPQLTWNGDDDALADLEPAHRVAERQDLGDALVAERERAARREERRR